MCSGCSGDYAGDFEGLGDSVSESSSSTGPVCWGRPIGDGNRLSDESVGGGIICPRHPPQRPQARIMTGLSNEP